MAESVVSFLLSKLDSLLVEEENLLKSVSTGIHRIKDELQSMRALLRDADARAESDARVKTWVKQVREAAYDIEDVLDECVLLHETKGFLRKARSFNKNSKMRHRIAKQIQELRNRVIDISSRKAHYDFEMIGQGPSSSCALSDQACHLRSTAHFVEEADLVGIDNPRNELIRLLVGRESRLRVISIVGMGGLGKTTVVGKVYSSEWVKTHFEAFAWITVSQTFSIEEIFRSMVKEISQGSLERVHVMGTDELMKELRSHLQRKRYVIVLDDLWKVNDWECIEIGLPKGECGSRVIITTRISEVADACASTSNHVYNLQPLPSEQGWALFCKKAFRSELGGNCPPELKPISEKFVQKCGGLPLAIRAIGGLLSTKAKTPVEWQKLYDRLGHQIESSSTLTIMNKILLLSYEDLPYYLKPCFMYVSIFPEDYKMRRMRLIQLWIAEGFVEKKERMTLEEVADYYLHELINRSLIQVASYTDYGTIEAFRFHDVVREIILLKAKEEGFVTFPNETELSDKTRRLVLHDIENIVPKNTSSHLRNFFMFLEHKTPFSFMRGCFSGFRLLKVLDLEGAGIGEFPNEIVNLFHLRFLSLRSTKIRILPESIGKLKNLETLDLHNTDIQELPISIVKLKHLRHLLGGPCLGPSASLFYRIRWVKVTHGVGSLRSLQQLGYICSDQGNGVMIEELGKLTQLKWLGVSELTSEDGSGICASIQKMTSLSSLTASSVMEGEGLLDLKSLSSPPPLLEHLHLKGRLEGFPHWIPSLSNLVHLKLELSGLKEDPFSDLQHLPNLMELKLDGAYEGEEFCCEEGGFQRLKSLFLKRLEELKLVSVAKGGMQNLQKLHIDQCWKLVKVPSGIEHLTCLKELHFYDVAGELRNSIERAGAEDHWKINHVPLLKFYEQEAN